LTVTDGAVVDYQAVIDYILARCGALGFKPEEFCLDMWGATSVSNSLIEKGYKTLEVRQGIHTLGEPTKAFREAVYARRLSHDGNPVLTWAVGNAVTRSDHNGNIMLDKQKAKQRIDLTLQKIDDLAKKYA
jgi:phage terminase large subunit-like protein